MQWMCWTWQSAVGFGILGTILLTMTIWDVLKPSVPRRGIMPFATTRGDRLFLSIVIFLLIHFTWLALWPTFIVAWPLVLALIMTILVMRWA
jgi:predicted small integral membrane protein